MNKPHQSRYRVYYEDTDAGGVVYYANYLKFAERGRTEFLRDQGIDQSVLKEQEDTLFVVRHVELDLKNAARLDNLITVETTVTAVHGASIEMTQRLLTEGTLLAEVKIRIACVRTCMKPKRLSEVIRTKFLKES